MIDRDYLEGNIGIRQELNQLVIKEARLNETLQASSGHLLAVLLQMEDSPVKETLEEMGITLGKVREKLQIVYGRKRKKGSDEDAVYVNPLTIELMQKVEEKAYHRALGDVSTYNVRNYTINIFEALVISGFDGVGTSILESLGVIPEVALEKVKEQQEVKSTEP